MRDTSPLPLPPPPSPRQKGKQAYKVSLLTDSVLVTSLDMDNFGRPLSEALAVVALSQVVSVAANILLPNWEESFATMSNLAYILSGCYHHFTLKPRSGSLCDPAFPLLLLGVSSFAFHGQPENHVQKHTLDLFFGWVVVLHLGCTALHAALTEVISEVQTTRRFAEVANILFMVIFSSALLVVSALYSQVYDNQLLFFIICAGSAVVFALTVRMRILKLTTMSVFVAAFESFSVFFIALSAVFVQGELVGRRLTYSANKDVYDLSHGCWHIQLGLTVSLLNVRFADILEQTEQPLLEQSFIMDVRLLDVSWLALFFVQGATMVFLKELEAPAFAMQALLSVVSAAHVAHGVRLAYVMRRPKKIVRASSVLPFVKLEQ